MKLRNDILKAVRSKSNVKRKVTRILDAYELEITNSKTRSIGYGKKKTS